jgi:hypothetical protein
MNSPEVGRIIAINLWLCLNNWTIIGRRLLPLPPG